MATSAFIGIEIEGITGTYLVTDGYPGTDAGAGTLLVTHYPDAIRASALIAGGEILSLGPQVGEKLNETFENYMLRGGYRQQSFYLDRDGWGRRTDPREVLRFRDRSELRTYLETTSRYAEYCYLLTADGWRFTPLRPRGPDGRLRWKLTDLTAWQRANPGTLAAT